MINRAAVLLKYKSPMVHWIKTADPTGDSLDITLEDANRDRTVYLVHEEVADSEEMLEGWLKQNCDTLFESELECWYVDESLWPEDRGYKVFVQWFSAECHSAIEDTLDEEILDEVL